MAIIKPVSNTSITKPTQYIPNAVSVHVPSRASAAMSMPEFSETLLALLGISNGRIWDSKFLKNHNCLRKQILAS